MLAELPSTPPHQGMPYNGTLKTASVRAGLQRALDNYKTGHINLPPQDPNAFDSDTRSFGETHASELSSIASTSSTSLVSGHTAAVTPPATSAAAHSVTAVPVPVQSIGRTSSGLSQGSVPPLDPTVLNNAPAPIPKTQGTVVTDPTPSAAAPPAVTSPVPTGPTVLETGVPLAAGAGGPGPSSGSLAHGRVTESPAATLDSTTSGISAAVPGHGAGVGSPAPYESAEDEKKRLEREERERVLRGERHASADGDAFPEVSTTKEEDAGGPPPYQPY